MCSLSDDKTTGQFAINCQLVGVGAGRRNQRGKENSAILLESLEKPQEANLIYVYVVAQKKCTMPVVSRTRVMMS